MKVIATRIRVTSIRVHQSDPPTFGAILKPFLAGFMFWHFTHHPAESYLSSDYGKRRESLLLIWSSRIVKLVCIAGERRC